jgi:hypothetical protein
MTKISCPSCGAVCDEANQAKRFNRRHPALCGARKAFSAQIAKGTRSVEADDHKIHEEDEAIGRRWDRLERMLGGTPR